MKVELMRYRNDSLSFYMNILAIVFNIIFLICVMANLNIVADYIIGIDALVNILFMLFAFLTAEKVKAYLPNWCFVSLALAAVQIARIFIVALPFAQKGQLADFKLVLAIISMVLSTGCLITGFIVSFIRSKKLGVYLAGISAGTVKDSIVDGDNASSGAVSGDNNADFYEGEIMDAMTEAHLTSDDGSDG